MSQNLGSEQHPYRTEPPRWGNGWMPPPPPKPGVIPLHPLGVGDILGGAFSTLRRHWKPLVGVVLAVQGIGLLLVAAAAGTAVASVYDDVSAVLDLPPGESADGSDVAAVFLAFVPAGVLLLLTMVLSAALTSTAGPAVVQEAVVGRPVTFGALWRRAWSRLPSATGTALLGGLIAGAPMLLLYAICIPLIIASADTSGPPVAVFVLIGGLLLCLPLSVWLSTRFSLASAASVCEGLRPVAALRRSVRLVDGAWWRVCGILMLAYLVAAAVGYAIQMPFGLLGLAGLLPAMLDEGGAEPGTIVLGLALYVLCLLLGLAFSMIFQIGFPQLAATLLYVDQRMRKENFAATLLATTATPAAPTSPAQAPPAAPVRDEDRGGGKDTEA